MLRLRHAAPGTLSQVRSVGCCLVFTLYTLRVSGSFAICWVGLQDDDLFGIFPTVFSFPVSSPTPAKRRLTVMVVNYNYISVPPVLTLSGRAVTDELSVSSGVIIFHLN